MGWGFVALLLTGRRRVRLFPLLLRHLVRVRLRARARARARVRVRAKTRARLRLRLWLRRMVRR